MLGELASPIRPGARTVSLLSISDLAIISAIEIDVISKHVLQRWTGVDEARGNAVKPTAHDAPGNQ
jgi:hypothetical protein